MEKQVKARGVYLEDWSEEGVALLNDLTPDSKEFESLPKVSIEKFEDSLVFEGQSGLLKVFPTQEMWERIKERRCDDGDDESLRYYNAYFPADDCTDEEVSVTFKIPKSIYNEIKKMVYFSEYDTMKDFVIDLILNKSVELSKFLIDNKFNVDPDVWFDIFDYEYYRNVKK